MISKKHGILRLLTGSTTMLLMLVSLAVAHDNVVVVPFPSGALGDATAADVVKGKTFSSRAAGRGAVGTLVLQYEIGVRGPAGGWVFYVTTDHLHGLEAAPEDLNEAFWGCEGTEISGADGTAVGTGAQNTSDILAGCTEAGIAAKLADDYEYNSYTDWFLPSKDELDLIYVNLHSLGVVGFANDYYWSSTEDNSCYNPTEVGCGTFAWEQYFTNGMQFIEDRYTNLRVRAVRAF